MEGYAAESVAANRKILRKRSFRNIERKAPKVKKRLAKDAEKERQQALKNGTDWSTEKNSRSPYVGWVDTIRNLWHNLLAIRLDLGSKTLSSIVYPWFI